MPQAPPPVTPMLDGPPPAQDGTQAAPPPVTAATFNGMAPAQQQGGDMQVIQIKMQLTQAIAEGLNKLAEIDPSLGPLSSQMMMQLRDGVRTSLQQGMGTSEPAPSSFGQMAGSVGGGR